MNTLWKNNKEKELAKISFLAGLILGLGLFVPLFLLSFKIIGKMNTLYLLLILMIFMFITHNRLKRIIEKNAKLKN